MVCPDCGMTTWDKDFGCRLPGCENYAVLVEPVGVFDTIYSDEETEEVSAE